MNKATISISTFVKFIIAIALLWPCAKNNAQITLSIGTPDISAYPTVRLAVRVEDSSSTLTGLLATDFALKENGIPVLPLQLNCPTTDNSTPLSVCFLLDRSPSMSYYDDPNKPYLDIDSTKWKNAKSGLLLVCSKLRTGDAAALVTFTNVLNLRQSFTTNTKTVVDAVEGLGLKANAGTHLFDALWMADTLEIKQPARRVVFLITDGQDQGSVRSQQAVIDALKKDSIAVYAIGLGVSGAGATALLQISVETGGKCFLIPTTEELPTIINELFQNIVTPDCMLSYMTSDTCRTGETRNIDLGVSTSGNAATATMQYSTPDFRSRTSFVLAAPPAMKTLQRCEMPLCIGGELRGGEATYASLRVSYDPALLALKQFRSNATLFASDFTLSETMPGEALVQSGGSIALKGVPYGAVDTLGWLTFDALQTASTVSTELAVEILSLSQNCEAGGKGSVSTLIIQALDGIHPPAGGIGDSFALEQNHPNPVSSLSGPGTVIDFTLIEKGWTTLDVFDFCGRRVVRLVDAELTAGTHSVAFAPTALPKGMYSYVLREGSNVAVRKLIWLQ